MDAHESESDALRPRCDPNAVIKTRFIPIVIRKRRIGGTWYDETSNEARRTGTEMILQVFPDPFPR